MASTIHRGLLPLDNGCQAENLYGRSGEAQRSSLRWGHPEDLQSHDESMADNYSATLPIPILSRQWRLSSCSVMPIHG